MKAYIVRLKETQELVGFYTAHSADELCSLVDEITDPGACEALDAGPGGICWGHPIATRVPERLNEDGELIDDEPSPGGWGLSEGWTAKTFESGIWVGLLL